MQRRLAPENDYRSLAVVDPGEPRLSVAVIIPAFERPALLQRTLAGLAGQQAYPAGLVSVIVADDGSETDIRAVVDGSGLDARYLRQEHDGYGAGRARNLGAAATAADVLLFLDADCLPVPDLIARHMAWHHRSPQAVVIGDRRFADTSDLDPATAGFAARIWQLRSDGEAEDWRSVLYRRTNGLAHGTEAFRAFLSGNVSVGRSHFAAAGGFAADFRSWGGEDTELGWRLFQAGLWFIPEPKARVYHQVQEESHAGEWRRDDRRANAALLTSKIPHRYYREPGGRRRYEVPKVSIVIAPAAGAHARVLADRLGRQRLRDWEAWFPLDGLEVPEPRIRHLPDDAGSDAQRFLRAVAAAEGEYVAVISGGVVPHPELLERCVHDLDGTPRASIVTVDTAEGRRVDADARLGAWGLPVFAMIRRRELAKVLPDHTDPEAAWSIALELSRTRFVPVPLITIPSSGQDPSAVEPSPVPQEAPTTGWRRTARGWIRRLVRRSSSPRPVLVHLGEPAGREALANAADWARVVEGRRGRAVVITGTLDDRTFEQCLAIDDPRLERVVIGAAAGNGPAADWADLLRTCLFVGLATNDDVATVRAWGYSGPAAITGVLGDDDDGVQAALTALREVLT